MNFYLFAGYNLRSSHVCSAFNLWILWAWYLQVHQDMMVISSKDEGGETVDKEDYSFANKMMVRPQQKMWIRIHKVTSFYEGIGGSSHVDLPRTVGCSQQEYARIVGVSPTKHGLKQQERRWSECGCNPRWCLVEPCSKGEGDIRWYSFGTSWHVLSLFGSTQEFHCSLLAFSFSRAFFFLCPSENAWQCCKQGR